jgi:hypothetical protein
MPEACSLEERYTITITKYEINSNFISFQSLTTQF